MNFVDLMGAACAGAVALAAAQPAGAGEFYGVRFNGQLVRFDMTAQTVTPLANIFSGPNTPNQFEELEFDGSGNLYAVRGFNDGGFPPNNNNDIYRVLNPNTGASVLSTTTDNSTARRHANLAWRPSNTTFYSNRNSSGHIGALSVTTGAFTPVSAVSNGQRNYMDAIAINPVDGLAYGLADYGDPFSGTVNINLLSLNLTTGIATRIGSLGIGSFHAKALRFDDQGDLYTVNYTNGNVYTVNTGSGAATLAFSPGAAFNQVTGLAFIVPGPASAGMLMIGAAALSGRSRRG